MDVQELLRFSVTKLVEKPELITITKMDVPEKLVYEIRVDSSDLAKVIGREGKIFKALRALIVIHHPNTPCDLVVDAFK